MQIHHIGGFFVIKYREILKASCTRSHAKGGSGSLPVSVILLILLYIIAGIVLAYTVYGRSIYAVGGNPEASRLSGLKVNLLTSSSYMISGLCASTAGLIIASRLGQG